MWRTAQSPRNGIEPCAIRPRVSISAHQTPRWPMQTRSTSSGSGMMTWSTRGGEKNPCRPARRRRHSRRIPRPPCRRSPAPRAAGATFQEGLDGDDRGGQAALHVAGAAPEHPAVADVARPRVHGPALPRRHHVDMAVEVDAGPRPAALAPGDHVDARMARGVAGRAFGAQVGDLEAAAAQPLADQLGAGRRRRPAG